MRRMIAYARVSRTNGRTGKDNFISPEAQIEKCRAWAHAHDVDLVEEVTELDESGGTMDRPGFKRALARITDGDADGMVVARLDRFGRQVAGIYSTVATIESAGGELASVADSFDLKTPTGRAMFGMLAIMAQFYYDTVKEGWEDIHERNVAAGIPTRVPWGYVRGEDRTLVPGPDAEWVPPVFRARAGGDEFKAIARWLNGQGVRTQKGARWTGPSVAVVLENRAYLGEVRYGDLVKTRAHIPLVTPAEFHAAQVTRPAKVATTGGGLLTGLVRCAACRYALDHSKATPSRPWSVYRCSQQHGAGRCPQPGQIKAVDLEAHVLRWMWTAMDAEQAAVASKLANTPGYAAAEAELREARAARALFEDDLDLIRLMGKERYKAQLAKHVERERAADTGLARVAGSEAGAILPGLDQWPDLSVDDRRAILRHGIDCIFLRGRPGRGRRLPVEWRTLVLGRGQGPGRDELPRAGNAEYVIRTFPFPDEEVSAPGVASG